MAGLALLLSLNRQAKTAVTMFLVFCAMLAADFYLTPFVFGIIRNIYLTVVRITRNPAFNLEVQHPRAL